MLDLEHIIASISENEDVLFLWSLVSADWEESSASALVEMIIRQWVKIRGFSYANAWIEQYKVAQKQTTQKSKGVHKQLISNPKVYFSCGQLRFRLVSSLIVNANYYCTVIKQYYAYMYINKNFITLRQS